MLYFALTTPLIFALALLAGVGEWASPVVVAHGVFAVGIIPLIFAAMSHFVPVLTRTGTPHKGVALLPFGAQAVGLVAVLSLAAWLPRGYLHLAAVLDAVLALILLAWMLQRSRCCLGPAHPGWRWYAASLGALAVALLVVPVLEHWPGAYGPLRRFHLHLNTLGFVGLAALGTLPLLLATVLKQASPVLTPWLRRNLPLFWFGAVLIAVGAAWWGPLAGAGALLMASGLLSLIRFWLRQDGLGVLLTPGAAPSLVAASLGLLLTIAFGVAHGLTILAPAPAIIAWGLAFLLPLVSGALTYLLPVWRYPGPAGVARETMAKRLCWASRSRALVFFLGGVAALLDWMPSGLIFSGLGLGLFLLALFGAWVARA